MDELELDLVWKLTAVGHVNRDVNELRVLLLKGILVEFTLSDVEGICAEKPVDLFFKLHEFR